MHKIKKVQSINCMHPFYDHNYGFCTKTVLFKKVFKTSSQKPYFWPGKLLTTKKVLFKKRFRAAMD